MRPVSGVVLRLRRQRGLGRWRQVLFDLFAQGLDFCVAVANGLEEVDLVVDFEAFVTMSPPS